MAVLSSLGQFRHARGLRWFYIISRLTAGVLLLRFGVYDRGAEFSEFGGEYFAWWIAPALFCETA
jgi:hypothetical protein